MHKIVADKLVGALRSGEYEQAKGRLKTEDGYCCLGVLCDIYRTENADQNGRWVETDYREESSYQFVVGQYVSGGVLPAPVMQWAGMETNNGGFNPNGEGTFTDALSSRNDRDWSFTNIADFIEKNYKTL